MLTIRPETAFDRDAVHLINELAFDGPTEARIVDATRAHGHETLSLVAVNDGVVVAHILFSPARIEAATDLYGMGLAPMAVHPAFQRRGFGSSLVREGLRQLDASGCPFVIVLGHPDYYPRFGFERASQFLIRPPWDGVPDDAFLVRFLPGSVPATRGTARYLSEFDEVV